MDVKNQGSSSSKNRILRIFFKTPFLSKKVSFSQALNEDKKSTVFKTHRKSLMILRAKRAKIRFNQKCRKMKKIKCDILSIF